MAPLRLGPVRVGALVDEVVADLVPTGRAVRFDVDVPESLEVHADRARLRQLLTNVLDNAVRHSPEGGRVAGHLRRSLGDRWRLDVADEGPGVAPADRERAFERFGTLADPAEGAATGGTGLGLAIARWVADPPRRHGPVRRPAARRVRRAAPRRPAPRPARPSVRTDHQEAPVPTDADAAHPARPAATPPPSYPGHPGAPSCPTPVLDPLFGRFWPDVAGRQPGRRPGRGRGRASWPGWCCRTTPPGLALFLVVAGGRAHGGVRRATPPRPVHPDLPGPGRRCARCRCVLLDASWIGVLCLLAGATALIAGVVRVRRFPEFVLAGLAWPLAGLRDLPWLGRSAARR